MVTRTRRRVHRNPGALVMNGSITSALKQAAPYALGVAGGFFGARALTNLALDHAPEGVPGWAVGTYAGAVGDVLVGLTVFIVTRKKMPRFASAFLAGSVASGIGRVASELLVGAQEAPGIAGLVNLNGLRDNDVDAETAHGNGLACNPAA